MRTVTSLSILLALQLGLAALLATRHDPLAGSQIDTPLLPANAVQRTDQIVIEASDTQSASADATAPDRTASDNGSNTTKVEILKKGGQWVLPGQFDAPADPSRVSALLDRLGTLKRGLPVATSQASLRRFKLTDSDFERRVQLKGGGTVLDTLYLGTSPGLRKSDARTAADHAVYAVDLPAYEVPSDPQSWLNADLLRGDARGLTELDVGANPADAVQLVKKAEAGGPSPIWSDPALSGNAHIDNAHAETLVTRLSQIQVEQVLGTESQSQWQQDRPVLTLQLKKDGKSAPIDWTVSKPSSGDYYVLKSSAHPWYFSVSATQAQTMIEAGARRQLIAAGKIDAKPAGKS